MRTCELCATAAARYPAQWMMLPTTPSGQPGAWWRPGSNGASGTRSPASACLAHHRPVANSRRRAPVACRTATASNGCREAWGRSPKVSTPTTDPGRMRSIMWNRLGRSGHRGIRLRPEAGGPVRDLGRRRGPRRGLWHGTGFRCRRQDGVQPVQVAHPGQQSVHARSLDRRHDIAPHPLPGFEATDARLVKLVGTSWTPRTSRSRSSRMLASLPLRRRVGDVPFTALTCWAAW